MTEKTIESNIDHAHTYKQYQQGLIFALIGAALFSIKPVLVKLAYQAGGDATSIMSLRAFSSLPLYLLMLVWSLRDSTNRQHIRRYGWQAAAIGVLGYYVASYLDISALESISAQLERLLVFLFPTFVVLITWYFQRQKPTKNTMWAILIGYLGIGFIVAHDVTYLGEKIWLGSSLAVGSAFIFACYLVLSKKVITIMGSQLFTSIGMGSAGIAILIHLLASEVNLSEMSSDLILIGVSLGIFCTVFPSYFIAAAMARLTPQQLSLTSNIGPAITAGFAVFLVNEPFTLYHVIGMTLVILSIFKLK